MRPAVPIAEIQNCARANGDFFIAGHSRYSMP
jgi:hypothetical protein